MKKQAKILWILLALTLTLVVGVFMIHATQTDESQINVSINKFNLSFKDNVYIKYAVLLDGIEAETLNSETFQILFWTEPQTAYEKGTEASVATTSTYENIEEQRHYIFTYKNLAAKNMTDEIYARAYVKVGDAVYYSDVEKYSILQYAYAQLGKLEGLTPTENEKLQALLTDMLTYGASAQEYFGYKTNRLATAEFYELTVDGGTLSDGTSYGLFLANDSVTVTAPETNSDGVPFSHWENRACENVSAERTASLTMPAADETYTPIYKKAPDLIFTKINNNTEYMVSGMNTSATDTEITIPDTYEGLPVTSIGNFAFKGCTNLTNVIIGNNVTSIGYSAFYGCTNLIEITIPDSVVSVDSNAFYNCTSLTGTAYGNGIYLGNASNPYVYLRKATATNITSVTIHESTKMIGESAFSGCTGLTSVTIPKNVTAIGVSAFQNCKNVSTLYYNATLVNDFDYNNEVFYNVGSSAGGFDLVIGANVKRIPSYLFHPHNTYGSSGHKIKSITFASGSQCESIGANAFKYCGLTSVTLPDSVKIIESNAFAANEKLTSFVFGNGVETIGREIFYSNSKIKSIVLPASVKSISPYAFYACALEKITFTRTTGWTCTNGTESVTLSSSDLSSASVACEYLKNTYYTYTWVRS